MSAWGAKSLTQKVVAPAWAEWFRAPGSVRQVRDDMGDGAQDDLQARRSGLSKQRDGCEMGGAGAADPAGDAGGRPCKTDMREAVNAIFYLLRTGSPWRYLPRNGFPPRSMVYSIFRKFQADGAWEAIWAELYTLLREHEGREASSTAAVTDSQTIKLAEKGAAKRRNQPPTRPMQWVTTPGRS